MALLSRAVVVAWSFISTSAWSPSIVFAALEGAVLILRLRPNRIPWKALSAALCALMATCALAYLLLPVLQEDTEGGIASIAALALKGWPIYPSQDAIQRYILAYGPFAFMARIPAYWIFGETLFAFKLTGVLAFFASMIGLYRICRSYASPGAALVGLGCCCVVFFRYMATSFWGRSDPLILCITVWCVWAVLEAPSWLVVLLAGVGFGALPNIKITAGAYAIPVLGLMVIRRGPRVAAGAVGLSAVVFSLPYFSSQVSIANYWFSLTNVRHGVNTDILIRNGQYSAILLLPVLVILFHRGKNHLALSKSQAIYLALTIFAMIASCFVGANIGSGSYHLIPYIVPIISLYYWLRSELPPQAADRPFARFAIAWTLTILALSTVNVREFASTLSHAAQGAVAVAEIQSVESRYRGRNVEVGIGSQFYDFRTVYNYVPTFDGQPFTIGGSAMRDLEIAGVDIPASTIGYFEKCGTQIWLIPKGDPPFTAGGYFGHTVFTERFRDAFLGHYKKTSSGPIYDVWSCLAD